MSRRDVADPLDEMDVTSTAVLKVQLYRDEVPAEWATVASSPIKQLIALVPKFPRCSNVHCDFKCGMYHLRVEENFDQVIHEIWGRRFQTLEGKATSADQSALFQVFLRVAAPALSELVASIVEGIYMEPRADASRTPDPILRHLWIPGANRDMAHHKLTRPCDMAWLWCE